MGGFGSSRAMSMQMTIGFMLQSSEVQKELELVDDQKQKLKTAGEELRAEMTKAFEETRNLSAEERRAKTTELMKPFEEKITKKLDEILLPHQMERAKQLAVQRMGTGAIADPKVQEELKITEDQKAKFREIINGVDQQRKETFGNQSPFSMDSDARRKWFQENGPKMEKFRQSMEEAGNKALDVLTPEQKEALDKMKGKKFDFPTPSFGRRGGGPRPEGQGGENK
jgi:Spy/CpxP family protein refolding chaperone